MTAFADLSEVINRMTGGNSGTPEHIWFFKDQRITSGASDSFSAGDMSSLWLQIGFPSHGSAPGAGAIPDNTTAGGMLQTDPGGGRQKWLLGMECWSNTPGTLILYDRLFHVSSLSGTSVAAQTVQSSPASPALTRYTDGKGNAAWVEVYTAIGTTARTITMDYTDQDGNTGNTSIATAIGGAGSLNDAQILIPLPLASGDSGVRAVNTVTLSASTGTAGDFGVTIAHILAAVPASTAGALGQKDFISQFPTPVEILTDACLALAFVASATGTAQLGGALHMVER